MVTGFNCHSTRKENETYINSYMMQNAFNVKNISDETFNFESNEILNAALVLEGGGLRSLYTSGVLDVFMENNIDFSCVLGVSAGALNAANYIANHIGRSARINIMHSNDTNYFGIRQFLLKGSVFNFDYLFFEPIKNLYPYSEDRIHNPKKRFLIGVTNCETGEAVYFEKNNYDDMVLALQASSSMQILCKTVIVDGITCLDGAIADPISVNKAFSEGYDKVVVILTNHFGYRNKERPMYVRFLYKVYYSKYPKLIAKLNNESFQYNSLIDEINEMEKERKIFVIRPSREINIGVMERDARKLTDLYFQGREDAQRLLSQLLEYLKH
jgi:predicted patatin/cPLA2 family phospholipase